MLIVGEKEAEEGRVSVRQQGGGEANGSMTIQEFADFINETVKKQMTVY
jgi:threonyl-tRNA synthetase